jgi:hypothetical protein
MRIRFFLLCIIATCSVNLSAQDSSIIKIRERYTEIQKWISEEFLTPVIVTTAVNRPAIGMQNTTISYYWNNMDSESYGGEEGDYVVKRDLYFVTVEYNIAASVKYHIEYLYDDKGKLLFCFYQEASTYDNIFKEIRFYFNNDKLIKYSNKDFTLNEDLSQGSVQKQNELSEKFSKETLAQANGYIKNASNYLETFNRLLEMESVH